MTNIQETPKSQDWELVKTRDTAVTKSQVIEAMSQVAELVKEIKWLPTSGERILKYREIPSPYPKGIIIDKELYKFDSTNGQDFSSVQYKNLSQESQAVYMNIRWDISDVFDPVWPKWSTPYDLNKHSNRVSKKAKSQIRISL